MVLLYCVKNKNELEKKMAIPLRTEEEIEKLRVACKLASDVLVMIEP